MSKHMKMEVIVKFDKPKNPEKQREKRIKTLSKIWARLCLENTSNLTLDQKK